MYVRACMYVHIYVLMYDCVCVYIYICMYVCMYVCMYACTCGGVMKPCGRASAHGVMGRHDGGTTELFLVPVSAP